jgi:hypothetical protein
LLTNKDIKRISRRYISADAGKRHARGQQQGRHNQHHTSCYLFFTHFSLPFINENYPLYLLNVFAFFGNKSQKKLLFPSPFFDEILNVSEKFVQYPLHIVPLFKESLPCKSNEDVKV